MSVIIKGMDKPKNCFGCRFNESDLYCSKNKGYIDRYDWTCDKPCPIIQLPDNHGRLIDANALEPDSEYDDGDFWAVSVGQIKNAPTIFEAEGE